VNGAFCCRNSSFFASHEIWRERRERKRSAALRDEDEDEDEDEG
jgi:hypothetical protein